MPQRRIVLVNRAANADARDGPLPGADAMVRAIQPVPFPPRNAKSRTLKKVCNFPSTLQFYRPNSGNAVNLAT
jgi:hypothetical protein